MAREHTKTGPTHSSHVKASQSKAKPRKVRQVASKSVPDQVPQNQHKQGCTNTQTSYQENNIRSRSEWHGWL